MKWGREGRSKDCFILMDKYIFEDLRIKYIIWCNLFGEVKLKERVVLTEVRGK